MLVNKRLLGAVGDIVDTEPDIWDRAMRINVNSVYHVSRALIPTIAEAADRLRRTLPG